MSRPILLAIASVTLQVPVASGQQIPKEELLFLTPAWEGERFEDGRPRVSDDILERMQLVTLEEAWAVLRGEGYDFQYEGGWQVLDDDGVLVGRAVTATFVPGRPDIHHQYDSRGREQGHHPGAPCCRRQRCRPTGEPTFGVQIHCTAS